ncbi:MAG TPA: urate oxidase [Candidatus Limnocylindrales bacterium]|nr:urate oxidase [Candidatus Limnocylindrales bacterium]
MSQAEIGPNRYGKSAIRLVKIIRDPSRHAVRDLTVAIALQGKFASSYVEGDNSLVIATDTMKNTVYALATEHLTGPIEGFGAVLARHFAAAEQVDRATVTIEEHEWRRLGEAPDAFSRDRSATRTAVVVGDPGGGLNVEAGIADLTLMKTSRSGFSGFPRDEYTTLPEVEDRIMATKVTAVWRYEGEPAYDESFAAIRSTLLDAFADHHSLSVQHTIWVVGRAIVERHPEVAEITMTMPNLHHWLVDLSPFGRPNDGEIFVATTEPHGLIQATVRRGE